MHKIVSGVLATALIAGTASQAFAAQSRHHARKETTVSEQFRKAGHTVEQPSQPSWQYSGWSAPAGR